MNEKRATITNFLRAFYVSTEILSPCKSNSKYNRVKIANDTKQTAFPIKNIILLPNLLIMSLMNMIYIRTHLR